MAARLAALLVTLAALAGCAGGDEAGDDVVPHDTVEGDSPGAEDLHDAPTVDEDAPDDEPADGDSADAEATDPRHDADAPAPACTVDDDCPASPPCQVGACRAGQCALVAVAGVDCDDGNPCTDEDRCSDDGRCAGSEVLCDAVGPCVQPVCNPASGRCDAPAADGSPCDDGDACSVGGRCGGGVCSVAPACDGPCLTGECAAVDGAAVCAPAADGLRCSVAGASDDRVCAAGVCVPTTCDGTGAPPRCATTSDCVDRCGDGDACDGAWVCAEGVCVVAPGSIVLCPPPDAPCVASRCDPATGACEAVPVADGTPCDDGLSCTQADQCSAGACVGTTLDCSASAGPCVLGVCDPSTGACGVARVDGTACDDGDVCNGVEFCEGGACVAGEPLVCEAGPCEVASCDPVVGCERRDAPDGSACGDADPCAGADVCRSGACVRDAPLVCDTSTACATTTCVAGVGCVTTAAGDGEPCGDGDPCNGAESCTAGECVAEEAPDCSTDEPCSIGYCDPVVGCASLPVDDGTSCSDGDACNGVETCRAGVCEPGTAPACESSACIVATCDATGGCVREPRPEGTRCDDSDAATIDDACTAGLCRGTPAGVLSFVPDTGQSGCWGVDGTPRSCDTVAGEDGGLTTNAMRLVAVDGHVVDEVTGLQWASTTPAATLTHAGALAHCDGLSLDGRDDWRAPTVRELVTVLDYGVAESVAAGMWRAPMSGVRAWMWTADLDPANELRALRVSARYGTTASQTRTVADGSVRCVRGASPVLEAVAYVVTADSGVYVPGTGLSWQRIPSGNLSWEGALAFCAGLRTAEGGGYRLPDVKELSTLIDVLRNNPGVDPALFTGVRAGQTFWTSTTANDAFREDAYSVALGGSGLIGVQQKSNFQQALCVRSCPCPDPACCNACRPITDGWGCDDGDPETIRDACGADGRCTGVAPGTPEPPPEPPFDCVTGLDCGQFGTCVRDADTGSESCACLFGVGGELCDVSTESVDGVAGCVPVVIGGVDRCFDPVFPSSRPFSSSGRGTSSAERGVEAPSAIIEAPGTFVVHDQGATSTCVPNAVNALLEARLGSDSRPLSEASTIHRYVGTGNTAAAEGLVCSGVNTWRFSQGLQRGERDPQPSIEHETDSASNELTYGGDGALSCNATAGLSGGLVLPDGTLPAPIEPVRVVALRSAAEARAVIRSGRAVVATVPVFAEQAAAWSPPLGPRWPSLSVATVPATNRPPHDTCVRDGSTGSQCGTNGGLCHAAKCVEASHAVVLVGYDGTGPDDFFYFLNSWGGDWGRGALLGGLLGPPGGWPGGIGKVTHGFIDRYAIGLVDFEQVSHPCRETCELGTFACLDGITAVRCDIVDGIGCTDFASRMDCNVGYRCEAGARGCVPNIGDRRCTSDESCTSSPADCACSAGQVCRPGAPGRGCVDADEHECAPGEIGCVREGGAAEVGVRWFCGLAGDGDDFRDRVPVSCASGEICDDGQCVRRCVPNAQRVCRADRPTEVWRADSCGDLEALDRTCTGGQVCTGQGVCAPCPSPDVLACHDDDQWWADGCTGALKRRAVDCGVSGYGEPRCDALGEYAIVDQFERGCRAGACFAERVEQRVACNGTTCSGGTCGPRCGDGLCAPGVENCSNCPQDCSCWNSTLSVCDSGRCVQCTRNTDCYPGCRCEANSCVYGCNACEPVGATRCGAGGDRQVCRRVNNCNAWVNESCGGSAACCQGTCSSTVPLAAPTLVSPADGATVAASSVRFQWGNPPGGARARIVLCRDRALTDCVAAWEPRPSYYYTTVTAPAGDWWWSVSATSACDAAPWGASAEPRQVRVR